MLAAQRSVRDMGRASQDSAYAKMVTRREIVRHSAPRMIPQRLAVDMGPVIFRADANAILGGLLGHRKTALSSVEVVRPIHARRVGFVEVMEAATVATQAIGEIHVRMPARALRTEFATARGNAVARAAIPEQLAKRSVQEA